MRGSKHHGGSMGQYNSNKSSFIEQLYKACFATELSINTSETADISTLGENDYYAVTLEAGQTYTITMSSDVLDSAYIVLRNADSQRVASDYQTSSETEATITYTATTTGTYYLDLSDLRDSSTGEYTILVANDSVATDDYTGSTSTTGTVEVGSTASGTLEAAGDNDWFAVTLVEGTIYDFSMLSDDFDSELVSLYDASGNLIDTSLTTLTYVADASATYYVGASQSSDTDTGTYLIGVTEVAE